MSRNHTRNRLAITVAASALCAAAMAGTAAPAFAHTELVGSNPAQGSAIAAAPPEIRLEFAEPVDPELSAIEVLGPDGDRWEQGAPVLAGDELVARLRPAAPPGPYLVNYRVPSADGHALAGVLNFTIATPDMPAYLKQQAAAQQAANPQAMRQEQPEQPSPVWPFAAGGVVLLAAAVLGVLRLRKSRT